MLKKNIGIFMFVLFSAFLVGCNNIKPVPNGFSNLSVDSNVSLDSNLSDSVISKVEKKDFTDSDLFITKLPESYEKRTKAICRQSARDAMIFMVNVTNKKLFNYESVVDYYFHLPLEEQNYIKYYITLHSKKNGCLGEFPDNDSIELSHSLVRINPKKDLVYATFCKASEEIFHALKVSKHFGVSLNYNQSLIYRKKMNAYDSNQLDLDITNILRSLSCVE